MIQSKGGREPGSWKGFLWVMGSIFLTPATRHGDNPGRKSLWASTHHRRSW